MKRNEERTITWACIYTHKKTPNYYEIYYKMRFQIQCIYLFSDNWISLNFINLEIIFSSHCIFKQKISCVCARVCRHLQLLLLFGSRILSREKIDWPIHLYFIVNFFIVLFLCLFLFLQTTCKIIFFAFVEQS